MTVDGSKRIGIFLPALVTGGAERVMINLANELATRDYDVRFILARKEGELRSEVSDDVSIVDLNSPQLPFIPSFGSIVDITTYLRTADLDVLISNLSHVNVLSIAAKYLSRSSVKLVVVEQNTISAQEAYKTKLALQLAKVLYPYADERVGVSDGVSDDLASAANLSRDSITTIYSPVIGPYIQKKSEQPLDHPWFDDDSIEVVLSVGNLRRQKRYPALVRVFDQVANQRDVKLVILGEGGDRDRIESEITKRGLEDDVDLPGQVSNPYKYMSRADVFALSSGWEGLPTVLIEALACGCPIVSTDCPSGPDEILKGGEYGTLVEVGDEAALADGILQTLDNKPSEERLRERSREFTAETAADKYETLLFRS